MQTRVSKLISEIKVVDPDVTMNSKFVIDGEVWEIDRWPLEGPVSRAHFDAWYLKCVGKVLQ
jgi:hypothetical protein